MFAIIKTGGKQYKIAENDVLRVEKLEGEAGSKLKISDVLMISDGSKSTVGTPLVSGASVEAEIVTHDRNDKIIVFKKKRRQNYRRKQGHRQHVTVLKILKIKAA